MLPSGSIARSYGESSRELQIRSQAPSGVMRYTPPADEPPPRSDADVVAPPCAGAGSAIATAVISVDTDTVAVTGVVVGSGVAAGVGVLVPPAPLTAAA